MVARPRSAFSEHMDFRVVECEDGRSAVECVIGKPHANTRGMAHGGVLSSLVDMACGIAVSYHPSIDGRAAVTVSLTVNFLHPAQLGDRLRAVGRRCGTAKRNIACEVEVTNQDGHTVATGMAMLRVVGSVS